MLTDEQLAALNDATENLRGMKDRAAVVAWAEDTLLRHGLLENVLSGQMEIAGMTKSEGPLFRLTERGQRRAESLIANGPTVGASLET